MSDIYERLDQAAAAPPATGNINRPVGAPGDYEFTIVESGYKLGKTSGFPMYSLRLRLKGQEVQDVWANVSIGCEGRSQRANNFLDKQLVHFFKAIGWDYRKKSDGGQDLPRNNDEALGFLGKSGVCHFKLESNEPYSPRLQPDWLKPVGMATPVATSAAVQAHPDEAQRPIGSQEHHDATPEEQGAPF